MWVLRYLNSFVSFPNSRADTLPSCHTSLGTNSAGGSGPGWVRLLTHLCGRDCCCVWTNLLLEVLLLLPSRAWWGRAVCEALSICIAQVGFPSEDGLFSCANIEIIDSTQLPPSPSPVSSRKWWPLKPKAPNIALPLLVWIDDNPESVAEEITEAQKMGVNVIQLTSTALAKAWVESNSGTYDCSTHMLLPINRCQISCDATMTPRK